MSPTTTSSNRAVCVTCTHWGSCLKHSIYVITYVITFSSLLFLFLRSALNNVIFCQISYNGLYLARSCNSGFRCLSRNQKNLPIVFANENNHHNYSSYALLQVPASGQPVHDGGMEGCEASRRINGCYWSLSKYMMVKPLRPGLHYSNMTAWSIIFAAFFNVIFEEVA